MGVEELKLPLELLHLVDFLAMVLKRHKTRHKHPREAKQHEKQPGMI